MVRDHRGGAVVDLEGREGIPGEPGVHDADAVREAFGESEGLALAATPGSRPSSQSVLGRTRQVRDEEVRIDRLIEGQPDLITGGDVLSAEQHGAVVVQHHVLRDVDRARGRIPLEQTGSQPELAPAGAQVAEVVVRAPGDHELIGIRTGGIEEVRRSRAIREVRKLRGQVEDVLDGDRRNHHVGVELDDDVEGGQIAFGHRRAEPVGRQSHRHRDRTGDDRHARVIDARRTVGTIDAVGPVIAEIVDAG